MLAVFVACVATSMLLAAVNDSFRHEESLGDTVALLLAFSAFMVVGVLIVAHRPGNAVGWIFSVIALLAITGALAEEWAAYAAVTRPGSLPGAVAAAWWASWTWYPTLSLVLAFTPLLFPTGRLLSPRWRLVAWPAAAVTSGVTGLAALQPTLDLGRTGRLAANPIGVAAVENPEHSGVGGVLFTMLGLLVLAAFASMVDRFRRARGDERQQLKWITFAAALLPLTLLDSLLPDPVSNFFFAVVVACLPVGAGVAILRYRLYDIDRLINRTLVYGLLTALLAGVYAGLVLLAGELSRGIGGRTPNWAVAASTLAVAALFQPARRRIQQAVDRRFNRRRYDAALTVEGFAARLRDHVDLDSLSAELLAAVEQTVQPTRTSLWLRPAAPRRG